MEYLLGIDVGTSGAKTAIINDDEGALLSISRREFGIDTPRPGWAEQEPDVWLAAMADTVREALAAADVPPGAIAAIGLSGQMHTTVCLDDHGAVLRPAISWADQRSKPQVEQVYARLGKAQLSAWTQNPLATGFTLASLLWLQQNEKATYSRIRHVLLPKDYVRYRLTGEIATDLTDASATSMMDVAAGSWHVELLRTFGIDPAVLPSIHDSTEVAGRLVPEAAAALGLRAGTPVVYGSGDQAAQAIGNAVIRPGVLSSTIGTGGQLLAPSNVPAHDHELRLHTFRHAAPARWFVMAAILAAGLSFAWLRRLLEVETYGMLADAAAAVGPGAGGLFFLPYLAGERTPHMDPAARGVFAGLTLRHERSHLARAVMEGVVLALRQGIELIEGLGVPAERVIASGGATGHSLWLQLQADIFDREIYQTQTQEAAAFGAALLAGTGVGIFSSVDAACGQLVRMSETVVRPLPANVARYDALYQRYIELYPALRAHFQAAAQDDGAGQ